MTTNNDYNSFIKSNDISRVAHIVRIKGDNKWFGIFPFIRKVVDKHDVYEGHLVYEHPDLLHFKDDTINKSTIINKLEYIVNDIHFRKCPMGSLASYTSNTEILSPMITPTTRVLSFTVAKQIMMRKVKNRMTTFIANHQLHNKSWDK